MNKFIRLNIEDKEIKILINEEIEKILKTKLGNTYRFDENGKMTYKGTAENQMLLYETILDILKATLRHEEEVPEETKKKISGDNSIKGKFHQSSIANQFFIKQYIIELAEDYYKYVQMKTARGPMIEENEGLKVEKDEKQIEMPTEEKKESSEDLSEQIKGSGQNATENLKLAKQVFLRAANDKFLGKYITQEMIDEIFSDVKICKDNKEFFEEYFIESLEGTPYKIVAFEDAEKADIKYFLSERENEEEGCMEFYDNQDEFLKKLGDKECESFLTAAYFDGESKIVVPQNATLETIVHELVHKSSKIGNDKTGIYDPANKLIKDGRLAWRKFGNLSNKLNEKVIRSLDESFTEMITRVVLPEKETSSGYDYGSELITKYYGICQDDSQRDNFFRAYYQKDENALNLLAMDVEKSIPIQDNLWFDFCKAIVSGEFFYTKGSIGDMKNMMSSEKIKKVFENLSRKKTLERSDSGESR